MGAEFAEPGIRCTCRRFDGPLRNRPSAGQWNWGPIPVVETREAHGLSHEHRDGESGRNCLRTRDRGQALGNDRKGTSFPGRRTAGEDRTRNLTRPAVQLAPSRPRRLGTCRAGSCSHRDWFAVRVTSTALRTRHVQFANARRIRRREHPRIRWVALGWVAEDHFGWLTW